MNKNKFNQSRGNPNHKFNEKQSKFKRSSKVDKKSPHKSQNPQHESQKRENDQHKNENGNKNKFIDENDSKKVHYVLNPKALRRKIKEIKESEQRVKEKSFLDKSKI